MNVTFCCPRCDTDGRVEVLSDAASLDCPHCDAKFSIPPDAVAGDRLTQCLACGCRDLFARKDFPQRLGVAIVVVGFALSCVAWSQYMVLLTFAILFATALVDVVLYFTMGESLTCYRCQAQYRGVSDLESHGAFELETHEKHRQQLARLKEASPQATTAK